MIFGWFLSHFLNPELDGNTGNNESKDKLLLAIRIQ